MSETPPPPGATSTYADAPPPSAPTPPSWKFVRAANGRIGGICESTAVATGLDVGLVRLAAIGAALWGPGLIAYLVLMAAVPRADRVDDPRITPAPPNVAKWIRIGLAVGGGLGAATLLGGIGWADWPFGAFYRDGGAIGVTLVAIAIAVIVLRRREDPPTGRSGGSAGPDGGSFPVPPPPAPPTPAPSSAPPSVTPPPPDPVSPEPSERDDTATLPLPPLTLPPAPSPLAVPPPEQPRPITDADDNRVALLITRITGWLIIAASLVVGVALIAAIRLGILELRLPVLMWTLGIAAFVTACVALIRSRSIAVISAAMGALVLVWALGALATRFDGATGTRTIVVTGEDELASRYHQAAGWLTVDLGALSLDEPTTIEIENGAGRVDVVVPDDAAVDVSADVWAGRSRVLGSVVDGWRVNDRVRETPTGATAVLTIDLDVGLGEARLCRASDAGANHRCSR